MRAVTLASNASHAVICLQLHCLSDMAGGLTGFEVAKDLMKIDFSPPSEAPEEFRALTFTAPPMKKGQGKPALLASQIYHQGKPI